MSELPTSVKFVSDLGSDPMKLQTRVIVDTDIYAAREMDNILIAASRLGLPVTIPVNYWGDTGMKRLVCSATAHLELLMGIPVWWFSITPELGDSLFVMSANISSLLVNNTGSQVHLVMNDEWAKMTVKEMYQGNEAILLVVQPETDVRDELFG